MKKIIKRILNAFLTKYGLIVTKKHELQILQKKNKLSIIDIYNLFKIFIFPDLHYAKGSLELLTQLNGTEIPEAYYLLAYLQKTLSLEGDVCEFGVANGATSTLLANEIFHTKKTLWLFDSFQGLSKPTEEDILINDIANLGSMSQYEGAMSYASSEVKQRLVSINFPEERTKIIEGYVEETTQKKNIPKKIAFAYVDLDLYNPIYVTLNFLHAKMTIGGYILVDDYGYFSEGGKKAVDKFIKEHKKTYSLLLPYTSLGKFCILYKHAN